MAATVIPKLPIKGERVVSFPTPKATVLHHLQTLRSFGEPSLQGISGAWTLSLPPMSDPVLKPRRCKVAGCDEISLALKLCGKHYQQNLSATGATRARRLGRLFRITPEEFQQIEEFQSAHPTYRRLVSRTGSRNAVEHRHKDGLIRGVMAPMLNRAYGLIERLYPDDTAEVLRALADFHEHHPASIALGAPRHGLLGSVKKKHKNIKYGGTA
jgi:hypothetical protein